MSDLTQHVFTYCLSCLDLDWKNPGRRPPTPVVEDKPEEANLPEVEENKDFDFEEEGAGGLVTPQRRTPGSALKGSARKQTTSFNNVLSNMKRHREIEQMDDTPSLTPN